MYKINYQMLIGKWSNIDLSKHKILSSYSSSSVLAEFIERNPHEVENSNNAPFLSGTTLPSTKMSEV